MPAAAAAQLSGMGGQGGAVAQQGVASGVDGNRCGSVVSQVSCSVLQCIAVCVAVYCNVLMAIVLGFVQQMDASVNGSLYGSVNSSLYGSHGGYGGNATAQQTNLDGGRGQGGGEHMNLFDGGASLQTSAAQSGVLQRQGSSLQQQQQDQHQLQLMLQQQVAILKSQLATRYTREDNYSADS